MLGGDILPVGMAIIADCAVGWLLDHKRFINEVYSVCLDVVPQGGSTVSPAGLSFACKDELFGIHSPFMMDSQFDKMYKKDPSEDNVIKSRKRVCISMVI